MSRIILTFLFVSVFNWTASSANAGSIFDNDPLRTPQLLIYRLWTPQLPIFGPCEGVPEVILEIYLDACSWET